MFLLREGLCRGNQGGGCHGCHEGPESDSAEVTKEVVVMKDQSQINRVNEKFYALAGNLVAPVIRGFGIWMTVSFEKHWTRCSQEYIVSL